MNAIHEGVRLLRISEVVDRVGLSKSMIYRLIGRGQFPRSAPLIPDAPEDGPREDRDPFAPVGWLSTEIDEWIAERAVARFSPGSAEIDSRPNAA